MYLRIQAWIFHEFFGIDVMPLCCFVPIRIESDRDREKEMRKGNGIKAKETQTIFLSIWVSSRLLLPFHLLILTPLFMAIMAFYFFLATFFSFFPIFFKLISFTYFVSVFLSVCLNSSFYCLANIFKLNSQFTRRAFKVNAEYTFLNVFEILKSWWSKHICNCSSKAKAT